MSEKQFVTPAWAVEDLIKHLKLPEPIVDPAAGTGRILEALKANGYTALFGVEIMPPRARIAGLHGEILTGSAFHPKIQTWMLERGKTFITAPPVNKLASFSTFCMTMAARVGGVSAIFIPQTHVTAALINKTKTRTMGYCEVVPVRQSVDYTKEGKQPQHNVWLISRCDLVPRLQDEVALVDGIR